MKHLSPGLLAGFLATALWACPKKDQPATEDRPLAQPPALPSSAPTSTVSVHQASPFSGSVSLGDDVRPEQVKEEDILFVMARLRLAGGGHGNLLAVQRHKGVTFPFHYEISPRDLMIPGTPFVGPFAVHARLDHDGDPLTKARGDLYAEVMEPVSPGQQEVNLVLGPEPTPPPDAPTGAGHPPAPPASAPSH